MCHTAAMTSPMTTTRRETLGSNFGVAKDPRIANRYAIPATVKEAMKSGPPRSPKLREQIVRATHNVAPSTYTLHSGMTFTVLPYLFVIVPPQGLYVEWALLPAFAGGGNS